MCFSFFPFFFFLNEFSFDINVSWHHLPSHKILEITRDTINLSKLLYLSLAQWAFADMQICLPWKTDKYKDLYGNKRTLSRNLHRWQNWPMNWKWANRPKSAQETHTMPRNNLLGEVNLFKFCSKQVQIFRLRARTLIPIYTISNKSLYFAHCET